jgi:hypothetical protein
MNRDPVLFGTIASQETAMCYYTAHITAQETLSLDVDSHWSQSHCHFASVDNALGSRMLLYERQALTITLPHWGLVILN